MVLDDASAYLALKTHDARFDGRLFVGVTSTGIYCRPVCRVRTPRPENCRFFTTPAQAEAQHFRPCLKCRPEVAPGWSHTDSSHALAQAAARDIERAVHEGRALPMPALAARLGVTDRHLRRIFQAAHGVAPLDYLGTQRLLLAKQLLTDTPLPVTQIALASGFESVRRFNTAFLERYRLNPSTLRRESRPAARTPAARTAVPQLTTLRLAYRPPYDTAAMLAFLQRRQLAGVEQIEGLTWRRTLALPCAGTRLAGWLACRFEPARHEVLLTVADSLAPVLGVLLHGVRHALDLDADAALIDPVLARRPIDTPGEPAPLLPAFAPGARLPGSLDGFELAVRVILGQQVTVKAARTLVQRLVAHLGAPVATPFPGLDRLFPSAQALAAADPETIGRLGIVRQRVRALQALATAVAEGRIELHRAAALEPTLAALRALPGIGEWTAQVIAMRALAWPDAFPATDIGVLNALGTRDPQRAAALADTWRPWRAYAVMRLWHHLETPPSEPAT